MSDTLSPTSSRLSLPLVPDAPLAAPTWQGFEVLSPLPEPALTPSAEAPEPLHPQGAYREAPAAPLRLLRRDSVAATGPMELLAPAGGKEAAYAAFHFGADAIYLGLKKFSARAEAENFTLEELDEVTAYAHRLTPRRRVFVTINTLIRQDELRELVEAVAALEDLGVDAVIVQDLGVAALIRQHFPRLELHASTQMAVHNRAGAEALRQLGFRRVVLARELTFEEVQDITAAAGMETEVFIHGALCYSYSGLCLFSAQTLGRSGNRGKCAYSCRDSYEVRGAPLTLRDGTAVKRDPQTGFPFSMKDLALPDHLPSLRAAGVSCVKVEGRKKSPLYVATTTDYYRRLLDDRLGEEDRIAQEADLQTVFSRPWTHLFVESHKDKEVADRDTVGHRGTLIGQVEAVVDGPSDSRLRFRTSRAIERHDGLQIDLPVLGKPYGFAVDRLWQVGRQGKRQEVFEVAEGADVEVSLPRDHPALPVGAPVYCSSSQAVKNHYRFAQPKPGAFHYRHDLHIELTLTAEHLTARGWVKAKEIVEVTQRLTGPFDVARDAAAVATAARAAFDKLGQTRFSLASFGFRNDETRFVPISALNSLRRDLVTELDNAMRLQRESQVAAIYSTVVPPSPVPTPGPFRWSLKVDRIGFLDALEEADVADVDEIVIDIARDHPTLLADQLEVWSQRIGRERLRLALPALTRAWEDRGLRQKIRRLRDAGWSRWEAANLSAWSYLDLDPTREVRELDLATDWSVYVVNRLAAQQLLSMGVRRFCLSPEDGLQNVRSLLTEFGPRAVLIVYQDTPQFLAESCAYANLIGGCPGKANCSFESMDMVSSHGEHVTALDYHCRTIVLNNGPFCLSPRLKDLSRAGATSLRADFVYRNYDPREVRDRWRKVRSGKAIMGGHAANFDRGLL